MKKIFTIKAYRYFIILIAILFAATVCIKLLSMRTYDPNNSRSRYNGYLMSHTVIVERAPEQVFNFITYHKSKHYLSLSKAHKKFEIINSNGLTQNAIILVEEYQKSEGVKHRMVVRELIPNRMIYFSSIPSQIYKKSNGEMKQVGSCNCYVYYDLKGISDNTKLTQTIVIEMPNFFIKFIADIMSSADGENEWQNHLVEELDALKEVIELHT